MKLLLVFAGLLITVESITLNFQESFPPESPCPRHFSYKYDKIWTGIVSISARKEKFPIKIKVRLSLAAVLKTKYVGLIELSEPSEYLLEKILDGKSQVVKYIVRFPLPTPLPHLLSITVNNVTICHSNPKSPNGIVTYITLEHEFPTNTVFINKTPSPGTSCGKVSSHWHSPYFRLTGHGEWPWLTAILVENEQGLEFHCSGSLISKKHVITAAHCVQNERDLHPFKPEDFVLYFGKHDLGRWGENNSQIRKVAHIIIHPEFTPEVYNADIAVMILMEEVEVNEYVVPVCIWSGDSALDSLVGRLGSVVGWGKDPAKRIINAEPRMFKLPIVNQEMCLRSRRDFIYITSNRTFCAGLRNGTGPCNGDSGSGLMLPNTNEIDTWELRGIISLSLLNPFNQTCDLSNYLIFTDVAKFSEWIYKIL